MDNNFNQQVPQNQQPVYQQQMPQQPVYQQQMPQQPMYQAAPKKPSNIDTTALVALICSGVGAFMALLGTILTCTCSASKTFEEGSDGYSLSAVFVVTILGVIVAVAGVVLGILAMKAKKDGKNKLAIVAAVVGVFAVLYGLIPTFTICGYNCSLNGQKDDYNPYGSSSDDAYDYLDDYLDDYGY